VLQFNVLTGNTAGNNVIQVAYNDGAGNNVANVGAAVGQYVYFLAQGTGASNQGQAGNGTPGMFFSNTTVQSISGNTITLATNLFGNVSNTFSIELDKAIVYQGGEMLSTYNQDTILVTPTRAANGNNTIAPVGNFSAGWVHVQKKTNNDGTVRYLKETLVALANPTAVQQSSGNTSFGSIVNGL
jgi:hypothetical protein